MLDGWYRENVIGGPGAFVLPAHGYGDFGRAIRRKFIVEISDAWSKASERKAAQLTNPPSAPPQ